MGRRRQAPWIHRNSRLLIAAIAGLGALNTAYLTVTKLFGGEAACPTQGCDLVLSSNYATVFGLPLALFGFLAYVGMVGLAIAPQFVSAEKNKELRLKVENATWLLLFAGATALLVFSAYLMYIMATEFVAQYGPGGICIYCIASAIFAAALLVLTLIGREWDDIGQLLFIGVLVGMLVLVGTFILYSPLRAGDTAEVSGQAGPPVTTPSGASELALAQHLKAVGAKMYGAYWCPHCHDQKQLFGLQASKQIPYVECAADGANSQTALCQSKTEVTGFPTWEINGQFYPGTRTLEELADASGYQGSRDFRN